MPLEFCLQWLDVLVDQVDQHLSEIGFGPVEEQVPEPRLDSQQKAFERNLAHVAAKIFKAGFTESHEAVAGHVDHGHVPLVDGVNRLAAQKSNGLEPIE